MKDHIPFYVEFAVNQTEEQVLKDANKYLKTCGKNYTLPVIDVIIGAIVNCLNINIKIWESHKGFKKEIEFEPERHKSPLMMTFLKMMSTMLMLIIMQLFSRRIPILIVMQVYYRSQRMKTY